MLVEASIWKQNLTCGETVSPLKFNFPNGRGKDARAKNVFLSLSSDCNNASLLDMISSDFEIP